MIYEDSVRIVSEEQLKELLDWLSEITMQELIWLKSYYDQHTKHETSKEDQK